MSDLPDKSLPVEIHAATRSYHTSLNRLVTSRLPLCLPPYSSDASTYLHGIRAFAEIYFAFESEWNSIIASFPETTDTSPGIAKLLQSLHHPSLLRTTRLKHDISLLSHHYTNHARQNPNSSITDSLTSQIQTRIHSHPHVLLAYTWILYLALFNGGRWIRFQLLSAPIWPPNIPAETYLTFWSFDPSSPSPNSAATADDSEPIKNAFKSRFEAVAAQLTASERHDVVEEAVQIFKLCTAIVDELDGGFATKAVTREGRLARAESVLLRSPLVSALTSQLFGILGWVWELVFAPVGGWRPVEKWGAAAGQMVWREEVEVR